MMNTTENTMTETTETTETTENEAIQRMLGSLPGDESGSPALRSVWAVEAAVRDVWHMIASEAARMSPRQLTDAIYASAHALEQVRSWEDPYVPRGTLNIYMKTLARKSREVASRLMCAVCTDREGADALSQARSDFFRHGGVGYDWRPDMEVTAEEALALVEDARSAFAAARECLPFPRRHGLY
jgi:hypothetical protein